MKSQYFRKHKLPETPGVYIFKDSKGRPLYIGRATSLRDRVKSYFSNDLIETRGPRIVDMVTKAKRISYQETASVLEAILLESLLIKRYQPFYNVDDRDDKSSQYVVITAEDWPRVFLARARDFEQAQASGLLSYKIKKSFGPFLESALIKDALRILRRLFPFRDQKSGDPRHENFYRSLGRSPQGSDELSRKEYLRSIGYLTMFFQGDSAKVRSLVRRDLARNIKDLRFEEAARNHRLINALDHISDMALIKRKEESPNSGYRIEAYDIAHLSGTNVVGAMTVSLAGKLESGQYRKFKLTKEANNDLVGLVEILSRRLNHPEWAYPDLIVVDGNEIQKKSAEAVLKARRINIPVVAVTKDDRHRASKILGWPELAKRYYREIIAVNAEAHRFAIRYHRLRRNTQPYQ